MKLRPGTPTCHYPVNSNSTFLSLSPQKYCITDCNTGLSFDLIDTWTLDTVTQVVRQVVHDVQQEGEVSHVVHVDVIGIRSDGPQLVLICVLHTWKKFKSILDESKDLQGRTRIYKDGALVSF